MPYFTSLFSCPFRWMKQVPTLEFYGFPKNSFVIFQWQMRVLGLTHSRSIDHFLKSQAKFLFSEDIPRSHIRLDPSCWGSNRK